MSSNAKITQAGDWEFIEPDTTDHILTRECKGIRVDQSGTANILSEGRVSATNAATNLGNYLQGEILPVQGKVKITTDATCRLQVLY